MTSDGTDPKSAIKAVLEANQAFYAAHEQRDLAAMASVWEQSATVACIHPGWPIVRGWPAVQETWRRIFSGPGRSQFILTNVMGSVRGVTAWVTLDENLMDRSNTGTIAATNVFVRTQHGWKLTLHHGSPVASRSPKSPIDSDD